MQSVLAKLRPGDIRMDPYAYFVIEDCLPNALYRDLANAYPSDDEVLGRDERHSRDARAQNRRHDLSAHRSLEPSSGVAPLWREFVRHHTAPAFFAEAARILGPAIRTTHPTLEARLGRPLEDMPSGVRFDPLVEPGAISLDCQIGINTAVQRPGSVRRVHTDAPEELFAMLLYFRRDDDDSHGGDLEILRWRDGRPRRFLGTETDPRDAVHVATIPYRANTLVGFVNSENSLHAVSARSVTPHSRRLVNILGEIDRVLPEGLFVKRQKAFARTRMKIDKMAERLAIRRPL